MVSGASERLENIMCTFVNGSLRGVYGDDAGARVKPR